METKQVMGVTQQCKLLEEMSTLDKLLCIVKQKDISAISKDETVLYVDYRNFYVIIIIFKNHSVLGIILP